MLFIEIVVLLVVATVLITLISSVGRPFAEIMAEKTRFKFKGIDSEAEARLLSRIEALEEDLRQTKGHVLELKESTEFAQKIIETKPETLKIAKEQ